MLRAFVRIAAPLLVLAAARPVFAIEVGQPAPDFTLQAVGGTLHTLSALRGKVVLLAFIGHG